MYVQSMVLKQANINCNILRDAIFNSSSTTVKEVDDLLNKTDPTKATGYDAIPPTLLKMRTTKLSPNITNLINQSIEKMFSDCIIKNESPPPL